MEELAARELIPGCEVVVFSLGMDPKAFKDRDVILWFNQQDGYREVIDMIGQRILRSASSVTEIANEEALFGMSPSEAIDAVGEEGFAAWSEPLRREHERKDLDLLPRHTAPEPSWRALEEIELPDSNCVPTAHHEVGCVLLRAYGDYLVREGQDVFFFAGTHWKEIPALEFKHFIRRSAQKVCGGRSKDKDLTSHYNILLDLMHTVPDGKSLYCHRPNLANFLDGTLEVLPDHSLKFREHDSNDLITWVLPYRYQDPRPENPVFRDWLKLTFGSDPDGQGKLRALRQVAGACLVSMFPRVVFLQGDGGTGKSTFAKLCASFVGEQNVAGVEPAHMNQASFMMEGLINKQVNIVTDISEARIDSATFKRIEDRFKFQINRKGRKVIRAEIPAMHMFCCNALPRGIDGASGAMDRRITIIEFNQSVGTEDGTHIREYEKHILKHGAGAVLQFCLDGLTDLCASGGVYFNPESGKEKLKEWKVDNDPVSSFFEIIREGGFPNISFDKRCSIKAIELWNAFAAYRASAGFHYPFGRRVFYAAVRKQGCQDFDDRHKIMHFGGIGSLLAIGHNESPANTGEPREHRHIQLLDFN